MKPSIVIFGAGGHGKVVADALMAQSAYNLLGFIDDFAETGSDVCFNKKVIGKCTDLQNIKKQAEFFIIALGDNQKRAQLFNLFSEFLKPAIIVHPSAIIASHATVAPGCVLLAGSIIGYNAGIGENTIVNAKALIDHDSKVGSHAHVAQGCTVGSFVELPPFITLELGQSVKSYTKIP